jgi:APA family basic amino acid/polyamine antiporter
VFAKVHPRFRTPWVNTIATGLITAVAAAFFDINTLGDMTSVGTAPRPSASSACRSSGCADPSGHSARFSVPLYPVLPALGIVAASR